MSLDSPMPLNESRRTLVRMMRLYFPFLAAVCVVGGLLGTLLLFYASQLPGLLLAVVALPGLALLIMVLHVAQAARALSQFPEFKDELEIQVPRQWMEGVYKLVGEIADKRGLPSADDIRLHAESVAHVYEDTRGRRILVLGGMAVATLSQRALAGVVAHELGHFGGGDTGLSRQARRSLLMMALLEHAFEASRVGALNPLAWLVRAYQHVFRLVRARASRDAEYEADRHYVAQVGRDECARTLILLNAIDVMPWSRLESIAEAHVATRQPIHQIFQLQAERARQIDKNDWRDACRKALKQKTAALDSHPLLRDRLAAIGIDRPRALELAQSLNQGGTPATKLFVNWALVEKLLTDKLMPIFYEIQGAKRELAQIFAGGPV